jgi:hypothetical protein
LPKFQVAPTLTFLIFSGSTKKEPRYTCLREAKASHQQRIWAKVSSPEVWEYLNDKLKQKSGKI